MQTQTLDTAARDSAERLLNEPEIKTYLARVLRVAFMEGAVWARGQQLEELKASVAQQQVSASSSSTEAASNAN